MEKIWLLIQVKRGFITEPEIFYSKADAIKRKMRLLEDFNEDYDEIEIFEKKLKRYSYA